MIWSEEGTTQGDPLAMPLYALATIPLINCLGSTPDVKKCWYADNASAAGHITSLRRWWENLRSSDPDYGYHANARKTWLITKQKHLSQAKELFQDTGVNITSQGRPYLGASLGSEEFCDQFVEEKVMEWQEELTRLDRVAIPQPYATFTAFTHGFIHKFMYLSRTTPFIEHLLQPLEDVIRSQLIPVWTGRAPPHNLDCELSALPPRLGGLGIVNSVSHSPKEFSLSIFGITMIVLWILVVSRAVSNPRTRNILSLLRAAPNVLFIIHYLRMRSSKNDRENWSGQNRTSRTACYGHGLKHVLHCG